MKDRYFSEVARALLISGARKATKFISKTETIKATHHGRPRRRDRRQEIVFTFGAPNYRERNFIKTAVKAGEPFPIKKVQLQFYPKKKPCKR